MTDRPHVLLSVAASLDGCIDDGSAERLVLSNEADLDRVDEQRAGVDAILVGAGTVRADDPRLVVRSPQRRSRRRQTGRPESPMAVVVSASGRLDPGARFLTAGDHAKLVYTTTDRLAATAERLTERAAVVATGNTVDFPAILADLAERGVTRVMVEGGGTVHTQLLSAGLFDELQLVVAPFFVGDPAAPRFAGAADYRNGPDRPLTLVEARPIADLVLLRYVPGRR